MTGIHVLENPIQNYAWGSRTAIAELLGRPSPAAQPEAELWMGAHPSAPSRVRSDGDSVSLEELVRARPEEVLGHKVAENFHRQLPFLFKVLAASEPLSLQVHPIREQAQAGFSRENNRGIPLSAATRNYKDVNHKPEVVCALGEFWALHGFRPIDDILSLLEEARLTSLGQPLQMLRSQPDERGLKEFFATLLQLDSGSRKGMIAEAAAAAEGAGADSPLRWVGRLCELYPDDAGVVAPLLLNLVHLEAGQALYLPSGILHNYLEGVAVELMANSDNVLRGGLTQKHIDLAELLELARFDAWAVATLEPEMGSKGEGIYRTPAEEFVLSVISVTEAHPYESAAERNVEIMICTEGEAKITDPASGTAIDWPKGVSLLVPATVEGYRIEGNGTIYRASVP